MMYLEIFTSRSTTPAAVVGDKIYHKPAFAAMHGPHSLVRIGPGCADRA